jgi:predicted nucleic acid-binding protein
MNSRRRLKILSPKDEGRTKDRVVLADTDLFFFYLRGGRYESQASSVIKEANEGIIELRISSEVYDDAISAIRAGDVPLDVAHGFVSDMKSIPHVALPMTAEIAQEALELYGSHGGRRRLSYFDSFHVATAKRYALPLLTSDRYMIEKAVVLGVGIKDLSLWR